MSEGWWWAGGHIFKGTLLGMWIFLIIANSAGSDHTMQLGTKLYQTRVHSLTARQPIVTQQMKFVDDLTSINGLNPRTQLEKIPEDLRLQQRPLPSHLVRDMNGFRMAGGDGNHKAQRELFHIHEQAALNRMEVNVKKTCIMYFNSTRTMTLSRG